MARRVLVVVALLLAGAAGPARAQWREVPGAAVDVGVGDGRPWITNDARAIFCLE